MVWGTVFPSRQSAVWNLSIKTWFFLFGNLGISRRAFHFLHASDNVFGWDFATSLIKGQLKTSLKNSTRCTCTAELSFGSGSRYANLSSLIILSASSTRDSSLSCLILIKARARWILQILRTAQISVQFTPYLINLSDQRDDHRLIPTRHPLKNRS